MTDRTIPGIPDDATISLETCRLPQCPNVDPQREHGHVAGVVVSWLLAQPEVRRPVYVYEVTSNVPLVPNVGLGNVSHVGPTSFAWGHLEVGQTQTVHDGPQSIHGAELTVTRLADR